MTSSPYLCKFVEVTNSMKNLYRRIIWPSYKTGVFLNSHINIEYDRRKGKESLHVLNYIKNKEYFKFQTSLVLRYLQILFSVNYLIDKVLKSYINNHEGFINVNVSGHKVRKIFWFPSAGHYLIPLWNVKHANKKNFFVECESTACLYYVPCSFCTDI